MNALALAVLAVTILFDVAGQLCFKIALDKPDAPGPPPALWQKVVTAPLIWAGVALYALDIASWLFVLSRLPLSVAFPLASLSYCGIAIASHFVLKERITRRRWAGTILVTLGAAIVSSTT